jgi:3-deoxy-D-manno-octulosonic-acid transferase
MHEDSRQPGPPPASIIREGLGFRAKSLASDNLQTALRPVAVPDPPGGGPAPLWPLLRERLLPSRKATRAEVWIHAVSVGEVEIAATLAQSLRGRVPDLSLLVTATTPAGVALLPSRFPGETGIFHRPSPFDFGPSVVRFFDDVRPGILVLVETELWPRTLAEAARRRIPVVVVSGRLSERSLRRLRIARPLFRRPLAAITRVAARTADDARRFAEAGIDSSRVFVAGDLKLDRPLAPEPAFAGRVRALAEGKPIIVAASLAEDEISVLLAARRRLEASGAGTFFLVAPRQPATFGEAAGRLASAGLRVVRRTEPGAGGEQADVFLLDTIGELASAYRCAAAALLGGTFVDKGGHNVLEPLRAGVPVVHGPSVWNIRSTLEAAAEAVFPARDGDDAGRVLLSLLRDADARRRAGDAASAFFAAHSGAAARAAEAILLLRGGTA